MAHTKAQGSVKGNRDSISKRLGIKLYAGQKASTGNIIARQRGSKVFPGKNVSMGKDFTLFAMGEGIVKFRTLRGKKIVEVVSA
ncbi:MAG: 50S ribosomal protein L27 [Patescibacteria group bacterium]